jgi:hypothetical protein
MGQLARDIIRFQKGEVVAGRIALRFYLSNSEIA